MKSVTEVNQQINDLIVDNNFVDDTLIGELSIEERFRYMMDSFSDDDINEMWLEMKKNDLPGRPNSSEKLTKTQLIALPAGTPVNLIYLTKETREPYCGFTTTFKGNTENKHFIYWEDQETPGEDCEQTIDSISEDGEFDPMYGDGTLIAFFTIAENIKQK